MQIKHSKALKTSLGSHPLPPTAIRALHCAVNAVNTILLIQCIVHIVHCTGHRALCCQCCELQTLQCYRYSKQCTAHRALHTTLYTSLYTAISTLQCTLRAITLYLSKINNTPLHQSPLEVHWMCFAPGYIFVFVVMCMF